MNMLNHIALIIGWAVMASAGIFALVALTSVSLIGYIWLKLIDYAVFKVFRVNQEVFALMWDRHQKRQAKAKEDQ